MQEPSSFDMAIAPDDSGTAGEGATKDPGEAVKIPGMPDGESARPSAVAKANTLTLWNLIAALLAGAITLGLARSVPGIIELLLQARPSIDTGSRLAASTLVRYTILILGMSISLSLLGISWSRVQWLAAALTFGLGFELQMAIHEAFKKNGIDFALPKLHIQVPPEFRK